MILYADTSALAKLVLEEEGSSVMLAASHRADVLASVAVAYPELRAAIAAAVRDGRVLPALRLGTRQQLESLWGHVATVPCDEPLIRRAGDLAEELALRGYDAVHLAGLVAMGSPDQVACACWDNQVRRAAQQLGYALVPA